MLMWTCFLNNLKKKKKYLHVNNEHPLYNFFKDVEQIKSSKWMEFVFSTNTHCGFSITSKCLEKVLVTYLLTGWKEKHV